MAATGNEVVLLRQLKDLYDSLVAKIGDVLTAGSVTTDKIANGAVTGIKIANGAVTNGKIAADAITADKIATGAVTSDAIANGTITAADIAAGVIPDVSGFITATAADGKYAAKSHTHPASQVTGLTASRALVSDTSGHPAVSAVTSTELGYLDGVTSKIQTQLNGKAATSHTHAAATTSAAGFMSAADKTKLNSLKNYTLPEATSTVLGGVKVASDEDAKAFLGY